MTNNGKKIACVSLASALCLGVGFSAVLGPISASAEIASLNGISNSDPLFLQQFGSLSVNMYSDVNAEYYWYNTAVPRFGDDEYSFSKLVYIEPATRANTILGYDAGELVTHFYSGDNYIPVDETEICTFVLTLDGLILNKAVFEGLCSSTSLFMPLGFNYSSSVRVEYVKDDGSIGVYSNTLNNFIYASEPLTTADESFTLAQLLGTSFFNQPLGISTGQSLIPYVYNFVSFTLEVVPTRDNPSAGNTDSLFVSLHSLPTDYTWLDYYDSVDVYNEYNLAQQGDTIVPPPADILFSPVEAFFATELFEGFTLGNLLAIALGCLLFGLFLKIFAGG